MVQAMEGTIVGHGARQTHELTSALGHLLERIGASSSHEDTEPSIFEMSADEVDAMLGMHRAVSASQAPSGTGDKPVDGRVTEPTGESGIQADGRPSDPDLEAVQAVPSDGLQELRKARIFEASVDRRAMLVSLTLPALLALIIAGVATWFVSPSDQPAHEPAAPPSQVEAASVTTVVTTLGSAVTTVPAGEFEAGAAAVVSDQMVGFEARAALQALGLSGAEVAVSDGRVTVDAVAPLDALADGYFTLKNQIAQAVSVDGVSGVEVRLELRGDAVTLRDMLDEISLGSPITFASGVAEVDSTHRTTLDLIAAAITSQPGLPVIVAGTTDSSGSSASNEALARSRAESVVGELVERGVPANRLQIVSYGELFPDGESVDRSVRFEVGA